MDDGGDGYDQGSAAPELYPCPLCEQPALKTAPAYRSVPGHGGKIIELARKAFRRPPKAQRVPAYTSLGLMPTDPRLVPAYTAALRAYCDDLDRVAATAPQDPGVRVKLYNLTRHLKAQQDIAREIRHRQRRLTVPVPES